VSMRKTPMVPGDRNRSFQTPAVHIHLMDRPRWKRGIDRVIRREWELNAY
jgi:hypothetical protein